MDADRVAVPAPGVTEVPIPTVALADSSDRQRRLAILEQVEVELADVEQALRRLDDGTYGRCEACGGSISGDTLAQSPSRRFCGECQAVVDASGRDQAGL